MPGVGSSNINSLRSLVFVRNFGSQVLENTDVKVRKDSGSIKITALDSRLSPKEISFNSKQFKIVNQKNKTSQDRLIDYFA